MNFKYPIQELGTVPSDLINYAERSIRKWEKKSDNYNFVLKDWKRLDSYFNPNNVKLEEVIGEKLLKYLLDFFPDHTLFGWSISYLPGLGSVVDHCDRMFFHRLAKRIIVITSPTTDVLNWHYHRDYLTKIPYVLEQKKIYRLNTAYTHGLKNYSKLERRGFYLDMMPTRLYNKFNNHSDILKVILSNATGIKYVFQ